MLHEKCTGCGRSKDGQCGVLHDALVQWTRLGGCSMRTHNLKATVPIKPVFMDPLKASKMAMKKKTH